MSKPQLTPAAKTKIGLRHLLGLTTLVAMAVAVSLAYRLNRSLIEKRDSLLVLSARPSFASDSKLAWAPMPRVADDFYSWHVSVPPGPDHELRLGIGLISERGIPPIVGKVIIPAGQHRVTLFTGDSVADEFRYVVYLDGEPVIEKTMGRDWLPGGWSSSGGISWPVSADSSTALQLNGQRYQTSIDFKDSYFNAQTDDYVTMIGYRLWIDQADRSYPPASPFMGFSGEWLHAGVGLRDGWRYGIPSALGEWSFTRPTLATTASVLQVEPEFITSDGTVHASQVFQQWQAYREVTGSTAQRWQEEPGQKTYSAFLHCNTKSQSVPHPVVELKWDINQPDALGFRLADTPANQSIVRWKLRFKDGLHHLWRQLQVAEGPWLAPADALRMGEVPNAGINPSSKKMAAIDLADATRQPVIGDILLRWQTNETLPLQIVSRNDNRYAGLQLYQGLPVTLQLQIPVSLNPKVTVEITDQSPAASGLTLPDGPIYQGIQIELDASTQDWIWLGGKSPNRIHRTGD